MKPTRWLAGAALFALLAWALVFAYGKGREERENEVQRDEPVIAPSRVATGDDGVVVRLDPAEASKLGLVTEAARSVSAAPTMQLNGVIVPDSARIAFLRAPVAGRLEAAPGVSWPELAAHVVAGVTIAQVADAKALVLPRSGVVTQVGARPGEIVQPGQVLLAVSDLTEPLARIAWSEGAPASPPARLTVQPLDRSGRSSTAQLVGPAFDVDPLTQRPAFNYRLAALVAGARGGAASGGRRAGGPCRGRRGGRTGGGGGAVGGAALGVCGTRAGTVQPRQGTHDDADAWGLGDARGHRTRRSHRDGGCGAIAVRGVQGAGTGGRRGRGVIYRR